MTEPNTVLPMRIDPEGMLRYYEEGPGLRVSDDHEGGFLEGILFAQILMGSGMEDELDAFHHKHSDAYMKRTRGSRK